MQFSLLFGRRQIKQHWPLLDETLR
jgi:hypothetical protein